MKVTSTEVLVLGDPEPRDADAPIGELAILRVHTDEGLSGVSEVFSVPAGVARATLEGPDSYLGSRLVGHDPLPPERTWRRVHDTLLHGSRRGWAMICLGAIDVALWDIWGKALARPVHALLGSAPPEPSVQPYCTVFGREREPEAMIRDQLGKVETALALGYRAVKVEPVESSPDTIVRLAREARRLCGPEVTLAVDVGYLWNDVATALRVVQRLEDLDIAFLETPFPVDALPAYRSLAQGTRVPIAAGEHTVTRWEFLDLMDRGGCRVVQPYMTTAGGLTEVRRIVEAAQARGVLVCPGNWSTALLGAATVHLAAASPVTPLVESAPAEAYGSPLRHALQEVGLPVVGGRIAAPDGPGIGFELPDSLINRFAL